MDWSIIAGGTGYYYPPYLYYPAVDYPIYHPYAATYGYGSYYNSYTGDMASRLECCASSQLFPR